MKEIIRMYYISLYGFSSDVNRMPLEIANVSVRFIYFHLCPCTHFKVASLWPAVCYIIHGTKDCQMLSWWTNNSLHSINIWDAITKVLPYCSLYHLPSHESNLTLLAWFLPDLAYLSMLFIFEMVCRSSPKNKYHAQISQLWGKWC